MQLRNRVAEFRATHGFSIDELSQRAGISTWTLNHIESDPGYAPQARVILRLCRVFRAELGRLFYIDWNAPDLDDIETADVHVAEGALLEVA